MDTTSPSKKTTRVNNQENRMIREKNCNIINTSYGNPVLLVMLYLLLFPFISNALLPRKHSLLTSYPLSHHLSITFYDIPWSMHIVGHYKYHITLYS